MHTHFVCVCLSVSVCLHHPTTTTIALMWQLRVSVMVTMFVTYFVYSIDTMFFVFFQEKSSASFVHHCVVVVTLYCQCSTPT